MSTFDSTDNNVARHQYRELSDEEKFNVSAIKDAGAAMIEFLHKLGGTKPGSDGLNSRNLELARDHIEDAVMRTVRHITG